MPQIQLNISDELHEILNDVSNQLNKTTEESVELALNFFLQMETVDYAILGKERFDSQSELIPLALESEEDEDELEYKLKFHPDALEEYEELEDEQQMLAICALVTRLFNEDEEEEAEIIETEHFPEMLIDETESSELLLTHFPFGDIVYAVNDEAIEIYLINFSEVELGDDLEDENLEFEIDEDEMEQDADFDDDMEKGTTKSN